MFAKKSTFSFSILFLVIILLFRCSGGDEASSLNTNRRIQLEPVFYAGFESGSIAADVGEEFAQTSYGAFSVVDNPVPSTVNPTSKVLRAERIEDGYGRAEYHTQRLPIVEKTYIYAWKEFFPPDFYNGKHIDWLLVGQWKTWPCEFYGTGEYAFGDVICNNAGGIFNEREISTDPLKLEQEYIFRAKPDCDSYLTSLELGVWHAYILEIHWTNTNNGHYRIYKDGKLLYSKSNVKTLFDRFIPGTCDMYWALGLYSSWVDEGAGSMVYYLDKMAVFDVDDDVTINDVLAWQGY